MCRWDELIAVERPKSQNALTLAMWHYGRALAYAGNASSRTRGESSRSLKKLRKELDRNMPWDTNKLGDVLDLASAALAARLESTPRVGCFQMETGRGAAGCIGDDEPPAWYYPIRESLGAAMLCRATRRGPRQFFAKACTEPE